MKSMLLCAACKRHAFATEERCPFCGLAFGPEARRALSRSPAPELSRKERYAIGAAIALTLAGVGCAKEEAPLPPEINAEATTAKAEPSASERPPPTPFEAPREEARQDAPSSPFLVGSPAATPTPPIETAAPPPTATVVAIKPTATATHTVKKRPPPPPDEDQLGGGPGWRNRGHRCQRTPNGQFVCPPYGCVFPDEACDVTRV